MKKIISILIISVCLSSAKAQSIIPSDTSYHTYRGAFIRRVVQYDEMNKNDFYYEFKQAKRKKRGQRVFTIVTLTIFTGLTTWYMAR